MYDKSPNRENLSEEILCELLQFLQYKIRHKCLTVSDAQALQKLFNDIDISGTADDFAKFYGQHPVTVRSVICRKYIGKPHRAVLYSFKQFRNILPALWRKRRCTNGDDNQFDAELNGELCNKLPKR